MAGEPRPCLLFSRRERRVIHSLVLGEAALSTTPRERLKELIYLSGMKQVEIARRVGEASQWVSNRLSGRSNITAVDVSRITSAMGIREADFYSEGNPFASTAKRRGQAPAETEPAASDATASELHDLDRQIERARAALRKASAAHLMAADRLQSLLDQKRTLISLAGKGLKRKQ